jgi:hypothetical protein
VARRFGDLIFRAMRHQFVVLCWRRADAAREAGSRHAHEGDPCCVVETRQRGYHGANQIRAFPTDAGLYHRMRERLVKAARAELAAEILNILDWICGLWKFPSRKSALPAI